MYDGELYAVHIPSHCRDNVSVAQYVEHDRRVQNMFQVTFPECAEGNAAHTLGKHVPHTLGNALP